MKRSVKNSKLETGQMIPLVVIMMLAIIGMVALILDGGSIISNRRTAQAAADSAALAGAQRACAGHSDAVTVAENFANENGASSVLVTVSGSQVTANVTVDNPSFFASVLGEDTLLASAEASAGCYGPKGNSVVPLAFYCRADTVGGINPDNYDCVMLTLNWENELKPLINGSTVSIDGNNYYMSGTNIRNSAGVPLMNYINIIMEDSKVCESEGGNFDCDLNNDGKDELHFGGNRGWLYLTSDGSTLKNYIGQGADSGINIKGHQWFTGKPGLTASLFKDMIDAGYVGQVVMVPLYNYMCEKGPTSSNHACVDAAHASPWPSEPANGDDLSTIRQSNKENYHVVTFAPFYVTCIKKQGGGSCPGFQYAEDHMGYNNKNTAVIEGYFIDGYPVSADSTTTCDINTGNCVISLSN